MPSCSRISALGLQPVCYESRKLNPAKTRYGAYERELLGIVWAVGKWRHYLASRHFTIQTDHDSLKNLSNQPAVNRRILEVGAGSAGV